MAEVTSVATTRVVHANRTDENWPDVYRSKTLMITPDQVEITYRYDAEKHDWAYREILIRGECYRPLVSGGRSSHGRQAVIVGGGLAPEEYHELINQQLLQVRLDLR